MVAVALVVMRATLVLPETADPTTARARTMLTKVVWGGMVFALELLVDGMVVAQVQAIGEGPREPHVGTAVMGSPVTRTASQGLVHRGSRFGYKLRTRGRG